MVHFLKAVNWVFVSISLAPGRCLGNRGSQRPHPSVVLGRENLCDSMKLHKTKGIRRKDPCISPSSVPSVSSILISDSQEFKRRTFVGFHLLIQTFTDFFNLFK